MTLSPREQKAREAKQRYNSQKYLLFDLETTGLDPRKNAILEIGAYILTDALEVADLPPFHTLVQPHREAIIDKRALNINNHHWASDPESEEFKKAATPEQAWKALEDFLRPHYDTLTWIVPVGWNVGFDEEFLKGFFFHIHQEEPVTGRPPWPFHYHKIDLLGVVRFFDARMGRARKSYKLEHIAQEYYGTVSKFAMHTSLGDSNMCIRVAMEAEKELLKHVRRE